MTKTYENATLAKYLVGCVVYFPLSSPPDGYLKANGAAISRSTYSDLFAVIGTTFGSGDGSTTFNLPDLRGEFVRCWDDGKGTDSGRSLGTSQSDAFRLHEHGIRLQFGNNASSSYPPPNAAYLFVNGDGTYSYTRYYGNYNNSQPIEPVGGSETRPRNISLLACIKY
jgi:phage-related tail fiber protein